MGLNMPWVVKGLIIATAIGTLALGYFKIISPDGVIEEAAENVLKEETGIDVTINSK